MSDSNLIVNSILFKLELAMKRALNRQINPHMKWEVFIKELIDELERVRTDQ